MQIALGLSWALRVSLLIAILVATVSGCAGEPGDDPSDDAESDVDKTTDALGKTTECRKDGKRFIFTVAAVFRGGNGQGDHAIVHVHVPKGNVDDGRDEGNISYDVQAKVHDKQGGREGRWVSIGSRGKYVSDGRKISGPDNIGAGWHKVKIDGLKRPMRRGDRVKFWMKFDDPWGDPECDTGYVLTQ